MTPSVPFRWTRLRRPFGRRSALEGAPRDGRGGARAGRFVMRLGIARGVWEHPVFLALASYLQARGVAIEVEYTATVALRWAGLRPRRMTLHHSAAIIDDTETGRFAVLDCHDWVTPFDVNIRDFAWDPRCVGILKSQYRPEPYRRYPLTRIRPWTYFEQDPVAIQAQLADLRQIVPDADALFFRGSEAWEGRAAILDGLRRGRMLNADQSRLEYGEYLRQLCTHRIALALPGMGNICHREIEAFACGVPVLMPRLKNVLHAGLQPGVHYISVDAIDPQDSPAAIGGKIAERYRQVIGDRALLAGVARNAMAWYEANVRFPKSLALTAELLGLLPASIRDGEDPGVCGEPERMISGGRVER